MERKILYKSYNLVHLQPVGATFFITFRLFESIPVSHFAKIKEERDLKIQFLKRTKPKGYLEEIRQERKRYFQKYDAVLDKVENGPMWLATPEIAKIVMDKLEQYDGQYYNLLAYCVMSNHVHVHIVIDTEKQIAGFDPNKFVDEGNYVEVKKIMQLIKGGSARAANLVLGRTGQHFWHRDYFDYFARNWKELHRILCYVVDNPVKAKLVEHWEDWPYTFWKTP